MIPEIHMIMRASTELEMIVPEDEPMDEAYFNKLKNKAKEVGRLYLLYWFNTKEKRFKAAVTPIFDVCDGNSQVAIVSKTYKP